MQVVVVDVLLARGFLLSSSADSYVNKRRGENHLFMSRAYFGAGLVTGTAALVLSPYTVRRVEGDSMRPTFNPEENISNGRYGT